VEALDGGELARSPKVLSTDLWVLSRIDPRVWAQLQWCQRFADECMESGAFPDRCSDRDLIFLSHHLPPTFGVAMLRQRLVRGLATRKHALLLEKHRAPRQ